MTPYVRRLAMPEPTRVEAYALELELVDAIRYVHCTCRRIARSLRPTESTQGSSRRFVNAAGNLARSGPARQP